MSIRIKKRRRKKGGGVRSQGVSSADIVEKLGCFLCIIFFLPIAIILLGRHYLHAHDLGMTQWITKRIEQKYKPYFDKLRATLTPEERKTGLLLDRLYCVVILLSLLAFIPGIAAVDLETTPTIYRALGGVLYPVCLVFGASGAAVEALTVLLALLRGTTYTRLTEAIILEGTMPPWGMSFTRFLMACAIVYAVAAVF